MKKIDTWLDIQRFVEEAHQIPIPVAEPDVEIFARATSQASKGRTFTNDVEREKYKV